MFLAVATFSLGGQSFRVGDWTAWKVKNGRTVYRNDGTNQYAWEFNLTGGNPALAGRLVQAHTTGFLWEANQFLDNPAAWEAHENDRIREANIGGGLAHAVGSGIHAIGHAVTDVVEFGVQLDEALFRPLTVNGNGLQLTDDALDVIPETLHDEAQLLTSIGGFAVVAAAAVTAVGGIGAIQSAASSVSEVVSGVSGVLSGAQEVVSALGDLPFGATGTVANTPAAVAATAPDGIVHDAAQGLGEGLGSIALLGFIAWLLLRRK